MPAPTLQYGLLARAAGTTPKVVRYFVDEGLLDPSRPDPVVQLRWVIDMRRAGFSLAEIRASLPALLGVRREQLGRVAERITAHIDEVAAQRSMLDETITELKAFAARVDQLYLEEAALKPTNDGTN